MQFLLIEDDEVDAEAFTKGFHQYLSYSLQVVSDGDTALTLLRGQGNQAALRRPYVIILDLNLPRLPGLDFLQILRQDPKLRRSIVFVLTSSSYEANQHRAYQYCVAGYILKDRLFDDRQSLFTLLAVYGRLNMFYY